MLFCRRFKGHPAVLVVPVGEALLAVMCFVIYGGARLAAVAGVPYKMMLWLGLVFAVLAAVAVRWIRSSKDGLLLSGIFVTKSLTRSNTHLEFQTGIRNYSIVFVSRQQGGEIRQKVMDYPFGGLALRNTEKLAKIFTLKYEKH